MHNVRSDSATLVYQGEPQQKLAKEN